LPASLVISRLLVVVATLALASTGCSGASGSNGTSAGDRPRLADVTPLADAKSHQGPSTAVLADAAIRPIADHPEPQLPVTVTDVQGTEVTVTDADRILALDIYGTLSRTVYELGLGDQVIGRDTSSGFAEIADKPLVTPVGHDLSAEAILALQPSVIVTDTSLGPWDVLLQMREAGIPVVIVDSHRSIDTVASLIEQVADALGVHDEGVRLAERTASAIAAKVAEIAAIAPAERERKLRTVFLYVRGQAGVYYMFGKDSGTDSLITALGARDVATEIGWQGMRPLNDEGLVKAAPDLILVMTHGLESVGGVDGLLTSFPALANTPAGQNRRIVDMADTDILAFGPATADVLDALAVAIYAPDARR
jgi:iron complex transport system substrate-binding protein